MKKHLFMASIATLLLAGCTSEKTTTNPFFAEQYGTEYEIPPFSEITTEHIREALLKGYEEQKQEIIGIADNADEPTLENTILALDNAGELLTKVSNVFGPLSSSNSTQEFRDLEKEIAPLSSEMSTLIYMNDKLFQRVKKLYDEQASKNYTKEQAKLIEKYYKRFVRNGALLSETDKQKLAELNKEISLAQLEFEQNLLHETNNTFVVVDKLEDRPCCRDGEEERPGRQMDVQHATCQLQPCSSVLY